MSLCCQWDSALLVRLCAPLPTKNLVFGRRISLIRRLLPFRLILGRPSVSPVRDGWAAPLEHHYLRFLSHHA